MCEAAVVVEHIVVVYFSPLQSLTSFTSSILGHCTSDSDEWVKGWMRGCVYE